MKITAGILRGYSLQSPPGKETRPSKDVVRESIFMILPSLTDLQILDLYAGTGALGIEALSRGASSCDFVDESDNACATIHHNTQHQAIVAKTDVYCEKVSKFLSHKYHQEYDVIFMDPPYAYAPTPDFETLPDFLHDGGLVVYLHKKHKLDRSLIDPLPKALVYVESRNYGKTGVSFYKKVDTDV